MERNPRPGHSERQLWWDAMFTKGACPCPDEAFQGDSFFTSLNRRLTSPCVSLDGDITLT